MASADMVAKMDEMEKEIKLLHDVMQARGVNSRGTCDIYGRKFTLPVSATQGPPPAWLGSAGRPSHLLPSQLLTLRALLLAGRRRAQGDRVQRLPRHVEVRQPAPPHVPDDLVRLLLVLLLHVRRCARRAAARGPRAAD